MRQCERWVRAATVCTEPSALQQTPQWIHMQQAEAASCYGDRVVWRPCYPVQTKHRRD